jgi:acyl carrier protein
MNRSEVFEALQEIFCDLFDDSAIKLTETTTADDIEGWDSLEHVNLIVMAEKRFKMKFSMNEILSLKNVGGMVDLVLSRQ